MGGLDWHGENVMVARRDQAAGEPCACDAPPTDVQTDAHLTGVKIYSERLQVRYPGVNPHLAGRAAHGAVVGNAAGSKVQQQLHRGAADGSGVAELGVHGDEHPGNPTGPALALLRVTVAAKELPPRDTFVLAEPPFLGRRQEL